jgi:hypothetical protein
VALYTNATWQTGFARRLRQRPAEDATWPADASRPRLPDGGDAVREMNLHLKGSGFSNEAIAHVRFVE